MLKIALCGAHGTGKTTLLKGIQDICDAPVLTTTMRTFYTNLGVNDFEKIPGDIRTIFQNHALLNQIRREDEFADKGFITDRSVLDYLSYTIISSSMADSQLEIYKALIKERLRHYTHFIYVPVEFDATAEHLRGDPKIQKVIAAVCEEYLDKWMPGRYLRVTGSVENRLSQIKQFIQV